MNAKPRLLWWVARQLHEMPLYERMRLMRSETVVSAAVIANAAGVPKALVEHRLSGHVQKIRLEYATGIQDKYRYNAIWIVLGRGPRELSTSSISDLREEVRSLARRVVKLSPASFTKPKGHLVDYEKVDAYSVIVIAATKNLINAAQCGWSNPILPRLESLQQLVLTTATPYQEGFLSYGLNCKKESTNIFRHRRTINTSTLKSINSDFHSV